MYLICFAGLSVIVLLMFALAYHDGFLFASQARDAAYEGRKIAVLIKHGGIWSDLLFLNLVGAYILNRYANDWNVRTFAMSFFIAIVVGIAPVMQWAAASKEVPEALARDGLLTIAGCVHYMYMALMFTFVAMFYFASSNVSTESAIWITVAFIVHIAIGLLQPPWVTHGSVPKDAFVFLGMGSTMLIGFATKLIYWG